MNRARTDDLDEIVALALARYLLSRHSVDPNPSGHSAPQLPKITHESPDDEGTPSLIPDKEYTVKDAIKITRLAEVTLQKMRADGRLPFHKRGTRVLILGKHLAQIMVKQLTAPDPAPEG